MDENRIRILIADDHPQVRSALRLLLQETLDVIIVGEADGLEQALELIGVKKPDLVLLDWPSPDGAAALTKLRAAVPDLTVIALSGSPEARREALAAGADAFFSRGDPPERLINSVNSCRHTLELKGDKK
jgi:DNA-binding NarL/FixJ family response regulator